MGRGGAGGAGGLRACGIGRGAGARMVMGRGGAARRHSVLCSPQAASLLQHLARLLWLLRLRAPPVAVPPSPHPCPRRPAVQPPPPSSSSRPSWAAARRTRPRQRPDVLLRHRLALAKQLAEQQPVVRPQALLRHAGVLEEKHVPPAGALGCAARRAAGACSRGAWRGWGGGWGVGEWAAGRRRWGPALGRRPAPACCGLARAPWCAAGARGARQQRRTTAPPPRPPAYPGARRSAPPAAPRARGW
jgi:hypothetical protein